MHKVRVLHVINSLAYGGAEMRVVSMVNRLDRRRFEPMLACLQGGGVLAQGLRDDIDLFDLGVSSKSTLPLGLLRLRGLLQRVRPQIVHTHLVHASLIGRTSARAAGVRCVLSTQHNAYYPKQDTFLHRLERRTWNLSTGIIALSVAVEKHLRNRGYKQLLRVIPTGVDVKGIVQLSKDASPFSFPYVLSVGHMRDHQKGHDVLLEAFRCLSESRPHLKLVIVGDGPGKQHLTRQITRAEMSNCVILAGNRSDVPTLMRWCRVFVLASRWEGFGRVLVEAMCLGCPIVSTTVEAIPEVIRHEETGVLVPPDHPGRLADAIERLLSDDTTARMLGGHARHLARAEFSLERMVEAEALFYEECLRGAY